MDPDSSVASTLRRVWESTFERSPGSIWEIGSRDGHDAASLSRAFPDAAVLCFEPNPDMWALVSENVRDLRNVRALPYALADTDGTLVFHKIDPTNTTTDWADGNPGASSLFPSNGEYPFERYAQVPVEVVGHRADTLISEGEGVPGLVWMDVQGAELLVLQGFGKQLGNVRMLYVELSLRPIYEGQVLADEVIRHLHSFGFRWHSVVQPGQWQFDAVFIKTTVPTLPLRVRDRLLTVASRLPGRPGIARHFPSPRVALRVVRRRIKRVIAATPRIPDSPTIATGSIRLAGLATGRKGPWPWVIRLACEAAQQSDPLRDAAGDMPPLEAIVPCVPKDFHSLPLVLAGIRAGSANPVARMTVVVPARVLAEAREVCGSEATVVPEDELIGERLRATVEERAPGGRAGWVLQQLVKFVGVMRSEYPGVLVVDADTVLIRPRVWLRGDTQLLVPSHEFHIPYETHFTSLFPYGSAPKCSWVTHHQLMRPSVVRSAFDLLGGGDSGLEAWMVAADSAQASALSEYHTYGRFLELLKPGTFVLGRWANVALSASELNRAANPTLPAVERLKALSVRYASRLSISAHSYLDS